MDLNNNCGEYDDAPEGEHISNPSYGCGMGEVNHEEGKDPVEDALYLPEFMSEFCAHILIIFAITDSIVRPLLNT